jgi:glycosyltransferase involved in cell wall biosynthesis
MKVLVSAYACEPNKGSEPGVGWDTVCAIARDHEVWVFTTATHRSGIERELNIQNSNIQNSNIQNSNIQNSNIHWVYLDPFNWVYDWTTGGKGIQWDVHLHHYLWQIKAYFVAKRLHQTVGFDLVHHATYGRYSAPSFLSLLPIPLVWGPVGGGESAPLSFWKDFNGKGKLYEFLRQVAKVSGEFDPFVHLTARRSAIALACTPETAKRLRALQVPRLEMLPGQTAVSEVDWQQLQGLKARREAERGDRPVRFLSLGRLIHWKGYHLGVRAFLAAKLENAEYWIVGTGAELESLKCLAKGDDRIKFLGSLPRSQALQVMADCDVLVHPSLHDFSPTVCVEAMAAGIPVLCLDLGGPSIQITDETGIRVPAQDPDQAVQDLAQAMVDLARDEERRSAMGVAGQERVRSFYRWETRGQIYSLLYLTLRL